MTWRVEFDRAAERELNKLDRQYARRILIFLSERVACLKDPCSLGEALKGVKFGEFWEYRVGDYRIIVRIEDEKLIVLVVRIGHRMDVYER
jgi:mRNA interferase RelE/StbE